MESNRKKADKLPSLYSYFTDVITSEAFYANQVFKKLIYVVLILVVLVGANFIYKEKYSIRVQEDYMTYVGMHHNVVKSSLLDAGFTNIREEVLRDLYYDEADQVGTVAEVSLNGVTTFHAGDRSRSDQDVIILYHDYIQIPVSQNYEDLKRMDYEEAKEHLIMDGFVNIEVTVDYDLVTGWLDKPKQVKSISIDGEEYFRAGDMFRQNAEIKIVYHEAEETEN